MTLLLDPEAIAQIRVVERAIGRNDLFSELVARLEGNLNGFGPAWLELIARGDTAGATRAAHTLKGAAANFGASADKQSQRPVQVRMAVADASGRLHIEFSGAYSRVEVTPS